ncbi:L-asparaginase [Bacilli bacterium PM5-9]|nr:L-asparaginase [Bacilli bacterium PM5-9]
MGGTIASTLDENGKEVVMDLTEYVNSFKEVSDTTEISINSFRQLSGYDTKVVDLIDTAKLIQDYIDNDEADGIIVIMGTNIMEEFAFGMQLLVQSEILIVFTGAMRTPSSKSSDGSGNLLASIRVASSESCRDLGVLVVMNDTIFSADTVKKNHPQNPSAFYSEFPLGYVAEGIPSIRVKPIRKYLPWINIKKEPLDVLIYTSYLGDTGKILSKVLDFDYAGVVVEGTGYGVVAEWVFDYLEEIYKEIPVVMASRIGFGDTMTESYGNGYGMTLYLEKHNYLFANQLDGRKSRILLTLLLMSECTDEQIKESFQMFSKHNY